MNLLPEDPRIYTDFNAILRDGRVSLETVGSRKDMRTHPREPGRWVLLSDGELECVAEIVMGDSYGTTARLLTDFWEINGKYCGLTEDFYSSEPAYGTIIDMGWYPDGDPAGQFVGLIVLDRNWGEPVAQMTTRRLEEAWTWFKHAVDDVQNGAYTYFPKS